MHEVRKNELAREFCELARDSKPNCESSLDAQDFFKKYVMGLSDDQMVRGIGQRSDEEKKKIQAAYFEGMEKVLQTLTGAEFQIAASYETIMNQIPRDEDCIRRNLRKVALEYGVIEPAGWGGK
jgi:hypothetical protein